MNKLGEFTDLFANQNVQFSIEGFIFNLFLAALFSFILSRIYIKYGNSLSNRQMFAKNFILITVTTMFIITVVKSSLALSLGLVGALSIIRFRTAVKEPEELAYLFFAISIGLGLGADQRLISVIAFMCITGVIVLKKQLFNKIKLKDNQNLHLIIAGNGPRKITLEQIIEKLEKYCSSVELKRFDEAKETLEASFLIEFDDFEKLNEAKRELQSLNDSIKITFLDNKTLF